jgi:azurin
MYPQLVLSLVLAAAPFTQAAPATQKPAADKAAPAAAGAAAKGVRTVEIVGTEDMKFSLATINAKPGEQIKVRLVVKGSMPKIAMAHNFVLLTKGAKVVDFATAAMNARATDFIPADKKADIVAHTTLAGAGETVEVTFKVPAAAGEYPYLCTFPGHFQAGMKGSLVVK